MNLFPINHINPVTCIKINVWNFELSYSVIGTCCEPAVKNLFNSFLAVVFIRICLGCNSNVFCRCKISVTSDIWLNNCSYITGKYFYKLHSQINMLCTLCAKHVYLTMQLVKQKNFARFGRGCCI